MVSVSSHANIMNINDLYKEAVNGAANRENELFEVLAARFRIIMRHRIEDKDDREEILQNTMLDIARKYKDIRIKYSFSYWAQKVLNLNILNYYRNKGRQVKRVKQLSNTIGNPDTPSPDHELRIRMLECFKMVNRAHVRHARILNLIYQGYNMDEICKKLKINLNNAYSILSRARSMFKECIERGVGIP
jgi:RNA polymerase sigma factor (sigma-70 family)